MFRKSQKIDELIENVAKLVRKSIKNWRINRKCCKFVLPFVVLFPKKSQKIARFQYQMIHLNELIENVANFFRKSPKSWWFNRKWAKNWWIDFFEMNISWCVGVWVCECVCVWWWIGCGARQLSSVIQPDYRCRRFNGLVSLQFQSFDSIAFSRRCCRCCL